MSLLIAVLALISGGQQYTDDEVSTEPIGGGGGFGGGGGGIRNGDPVDEPYIVLEPVGISKVSKAQIITSPYLPAAGRVEPLDSGDIGVITPIGKGKFIRTVIPKEKLKDSEWRVQEPVYKGKYKVL